MRQLMWITIWIFFFGIGPIAAPSAVWGRNLVTADGVPVIDMGPDKQERQQIREQQDRQDAADRKAEAKEDAAAEAAADSRRERAYDQSKAERRKKIERIRGTKSTSWQLNH